VKIAKIDDIHIFFLRQQLCGEGLEGPFVPQGIHSQNFHDRNSFRAKNRFCTEELKIICIL
jgi:hypothetical protein